MFFHNATITLLLSSYGYAVIFAFVGIESLGVPLPGETVLIAAGLYAGASHHLQITWVIVAAAAAAITGDNIGFALGRTGGYRVLRRYGKYVRLGEAKLKVGRYVFLRHGGKIVFFGRFVSILRTYAALFAGTNRMAWPKFLAFNAAGGVLWAVAYGVGSYFLGGAVRHLSHTLDIALGALAIAAIVTGGILLKRNEDHLEKAADRALPGPLDEPETPQGD